MLGGNLIRDDATAISPWINVALYVVLFSVPLVLAMVWGTNGIADEAYVTLHYAENLSTAQGWGVHRLDDQQLFRAPLYTAVLAVLSWLGLPLRQTSLAVSALGWSVAALTISGVGRATGHATAGAVAAVFVTVSPIVVATWSTEIAWLVALVCLAVWASVVRRWTAQVVTVALLLLTYGNVTTWALALALLYIQVRATERLSWWHGLILTFAIAVWGVLWGRRIVAVPQPAGDWAVWGHYVRQLLAESDFYWFYVPFVCIGVCSLPTKTSRLGLLWVAIVLLNGWVADRSLLGVACLFSTGLGIERCLLRLTRACELRLSAVQMTIGITLLAVLSVGIANTTSLVKRKAVRGITRHALERQAGEWIRVNSAPDAIVFGSARVGYFAQRQTLWWDGNRRETSPMTTTLDVLEVSRPDFCVSFKSLPWDDMQRTGWFQDNYLPRQTFASAYDVTSPVTVWERRPRDFALGDYHPLSVRLPDGRYWIGYTTRSSRIVPGDDVALTLFTYEPTPADTAPQTRIYLSVPGDGGKLAQQDTKLSPEVVVDDARGGRVVAEQFILTTPEDLSIGAYYLSASMQTSNGERFAKLYQGESTISIDRVTLDYVVVPWRGSLDMMQPVGAAIGRGITLVGYEVVSTTAPGTTLEVTLYWEASQRLDDSSDIYFVFVHLLDAEGNLVAQHDGPPRSGYYPHQAWIPGEIVPDIHPLALDAQLPTGTYRLQVGMYRWPVLERLPAWSVEGATLPDGIVVLQMVKVE